MTTQDLQTILNPVLTTIITAVITAVGGIIVAYVGVLKNRAIESLQAVKDEHARKALEAAINKTDEIIKAVVTSIEQEEKQEILKAMEDGKVTRDELVKLRDVAVARVQNQLVPETYNLLSDAFGDLSAYLSQKVSQQVFQLKQSEN